MKYPCANTRTNVISMRVITGKKKYANCGNVAETYAVLDSCSQGTFMLESLLRT